MKKFLFIIITVSTSFVYAQQTYTEAFDSVFMHISRADANTGILYERVFPFAELMRFNSTITSVDTSNLEHFIQSYNELYIAAFLPSTLPFSTDSLKTIIKSRTSAVDIGIIHFNYNTMDTNVMRQKLFFDTDTVLHEDTSIATPLYVENTALIISPLITTIREATVVFLLDNIFYFDNTGNTVTELQIDFDDGLGFRSVMFNDAIPITYPHEGEKTLCFRTVFANGDTLIAYALLNYFSMPQSISFLSGYPYIDRLEGDEAITAKISHPNAYTGGNFSLNKGDVWIYYANSDKQLRKPVLIVDGFDPGNKRRIEEKKDDDANKTIWEMLYYDNSTKHIGLELLLKGYDLVILDLPDGGGYIEQNAMVCIEVINKINQLLDISGSKEEIVIIGPSMGGQITRYALAYMEQHSEDPNTNFGKHNCRLWVSFDSPHQGANISMGAQAFIHYFEALDKAKEIWEKTLNCPAAQQMLIYHKANTGGKFSTYYTNLSNIGYPNNLRKIAVANGSLNGTSNGSAKDLVLKMVAPYVVLNLDARIWLSPSYGEKNKVFQASWIVFIPFIFSPPSLCIPAPITWEVTAPSNFCSIDAAPGGYYNTFKQFEGVTNIAVIDIYRYNHCFMPIPSVLDLSGDLNYCTDISNRNMVADNMTPFDAYWGPINKNMEHVSFDQELVDWLFNEVETYIEGERSIPVCEIQSYTLHLPSGKENTNVTWYCSSNLKIVAGKNSNTVLIKATGKGDAWIYAEVDNLTHSQKLSKFYITTTDANMYENAPLLFAGNYEWNQPYQLLEPLHISSGTTLTIRNTLYCSPTVKIVVYPGAKLIIDGGILTNICDGELWQGIYVKGNPSDPTQYESMQGVVELINGAVIENAVCAINVGVTYNRLRGSYIYIGGGIVKAMNALFINNKKAIIFGPYERHLQVGLTVNRNNTSWFENCDFIINSNALFNINEFKEHVKLIGVRGITFERCSFNGMNYMGTAIYSSSSGFRLGYQLIFNPNQNRNHFSNFNIAIRIENGGTKASSIYNSDFNANNICILAEGADELYIRANTLNIPYSPYYGPTTGISLTNCSRFYIDNNTFHGEHQCNYGLIVHHSGDKNNIVKNNTFLHLRIACLAYGWNSDGADGTKGLQYHCNWYEENEKDIVVKDDGNENGNIRFVQGEADKASGNIFSLHRMNLHSPDYDFQYFYKINSPRHEPLNSSPNIYLRPKYFDVCNSQIGVINPDIAPTTPPTNWNDELTDQYNQINDMLLPLKDHYISMGYNQFPIDWQMYFYGGHIPPHLEEQVSLYYEINDLENELSEVCKQAVYYVHSDELFDFEAYHSWLTRTRSPEADYLLAESYYETEQYGECFNVLDNIPSQYETFNDIEHQNYLSFYNLKEQLRGVGQTWSDISEGSVEYQQLNDIAESGINGAAFKARAVFSAYFNQDYPPVISEPELLDLCIYIANLTGDETSGEEVGITMQKNDTSKLSLRPNPALDELTIDNGLTNIQEVSIFDVLGKELKRCFVNNSKITLNIGDLSSGIYILKASTQKEIHIKKFVKE